MANGMICEEKYQDFTDFSQSVDSIFSGRIAEFFGQNSGLIEVKRVYKGDHRYAGNFVIIEGFARCNSEKVPADFKIGDTRLFFAKLKFGGVFTLHSPLVPITLANLRRVDKLAQKIQSRRHLRFLPNNSPGSKTSIIFEFEFMPGC